MKFLPVILVLLSASFSSAQQPDLSTKATNFLSTLNETLKAKALYKFTDEERLNWHFVPRSRNGVCFRDLNDSQTESGLSLLRSSLSTQGYEKSIAIFSLENVLRVVENRGGQDTYRDPLNYYLTIFGSPSPDKIWGWRFEGHHISLNFSTKNNKIESSTPSFFGSNPAIVGEGKDKGKQVLKEETEQAFEFMSLLQPEQLKVAIIANEALNEIVSYNSRKALPLTPKGLSYKEMNVAQREKLVQLLNVYVNNYELGFSSKLREKINKAGLDNLSFAWAGSLQANTGYYYRIQGPMLLIELDNTQNNANHVHSVVRDLTNDFGEDILREHYEKEHRDN